MVEELQANSGLDRIIAKLDELHLKDVTIGKFQALEAFSNYKRKPEEATNENIVELEKRYYKIKQYGTTLLDDFFACWNLSKLEETITKLPIEESNTSSADFGEA